MSILYGCLLIDIPRWRSFSLPHRPNSEIPQSSKRVIRFPKDSTCALTINLCIALRVRLWLVVSLLGKTIGRDRRESPCIARKVFVTHTPRTGCDVVSIVNSRWMSPQLNGMGGVYCQDCDIAPALPTDDSTELRGVRPRATDPIAAGRLWQLSEQLTGVGIDWARGLSNLHFDWQSLILLGVNDPTKIHLNLKLRILFYSLHPNY